VAEHLTVETAGSQRGPLGRDSLEGGSMTSFGQWLVEIGLGRYDEVFASNEIDFDVIRSLTDVDLRELGLALGDRKRVLQAIAKLDLQPGADTLTAPASLPETAVSQAGERRQLTVMFLASLEWARRQQAKMWELRTSTSLAQMWQSQGKRQNAYELLAPVYDWFTEGFDTKDLLDAKALLDELA
jgi:hypothetical protein